MEVSNVKENKIDINSIFLEYSFQTDQVSFSVVYTIIGTVGTDPKTHVYWVSLKLDYIGGIL